MEYISRRIIDEMAKKKWNQVILSQKADVSQSTVNRILKTGTDARIGTLNKIAKALNIPVEYLVTEDETKALLCLEISQLDDSEKQQALSHFEKEKLYKESKNPSK